MGRNEGMRKKKQKTPATTPSPADRSMDVSSGAADTIASPVPPSANQSSSSSSSASFAISPPRSPDLRESPQSLISSLADAKSPTSPDSSATDMSLTRLLHSIAEASTPSKSILDEPGADRTQDETADVSVDRLAAFHHSLVSEQGRLASCASSILRIRQIAGGHGEDALAAAVRSSISTMRNTHQQWEDMVGRVDEAIERERDMSGLSWEIRDQEFSRRVQRRVRASRLAFLRQLALLVVIAAAVVIIVVFRPQLQQALRAYASPAQAPPF